MLTAGHLVLCTQKAVSGFHVPTTLVSYLLLLGQGPVCNWIIQLKSISCGLYLAFVLELSTLENDVRSLVLQESHGL